MEKILEKYEHHSYADRALHFKEADPQADWCLECAKLKARVESLQKSQRHFMGEQLEILSIKELQHLEQQLESSLKQIRSRKIHIMLDSIADLQKKERTLQEQNKALEKEVKEKEKARQNTIWEQQQRSSTANPICRNYQPLFAEEEPPPAPLRLGSSMLPRWMLSHLTG